LTELDSPATRLRDVVVVNEQTGEQWRAGTARIQAGLILIETARATCPPDGLLGHPAATYSIVAFDGGNRGRRFFNLKFDRDVSRAPKVYAFR
jgi:hypothetical protein